MPLGWDFDIDGFPAGNAWFFFFRVVKCITEVMREKRQGAIVLRCDVFGLDFVKNIIVSKINVNIFFFTDVFPAFR